MVRVNENYLKIQSSYLFTGSLPIFGGGFLLAGSVV